MTQEQQIITVGSYVVTRNRINGAYIVGRVIYNCGGDYAQPKVLICELLTNWKSAFYVTALVAITEEEALCCMLGQENGSARRVYATAQDAIVALSTGEIGVDTPFEVIGP